MSSKELLKDCEEMLSERDRKVRDEAYNEGLVDGLMEVFSEDFITVEQLLRFAHHLGVRADVEERLDDAEVEYD